MLLDAARSLLLVVDVQERLLPAMAAPREVVANGAILGAAAARLGVPAVISEQYPRGLGHTVAELRAAMPGARIVEKTEFSCAANPELALLLGADGRDQAVICGIEAHVCVLQTALGLHGTGVTPFVVADAISSRREASRETALRRLAGAGVAAVTAEMVLFEWLGRAGTPQFRELSALIR